MFRARGGWICIVGRMMKRSGPSRPSRRRILAALAASTLAVACEPTAKRVIETGSGSVAAEAGSGGITPVATVAVTVGAEGDLDGGGVEATGPPLSEGGQYSGVPRR